MIINMKIGVPRGLGIYEYPILFESFFTNLGIEVVYSDKTNKEILNNGINLDIDENCLASKIFLGHVDNLVKRKEKEGIDYIFIPRFCTFENKDTICVKFFAIYDICNNIFNSNFITLNIDYENNKNELKGFLKLGKELGFKQSQIISSYFYSRDMQKKYNEKELKIQNLKLNNKADNKLNILIVGHPYILYDSLVGVPILDKLKKMETNIYFANINKFNMQNNKILKRKSEKNKNLYLKISNSIYWKSSKNLLNGISENLNKIDGIIYLSVFPCATDSLVNELAMRKTKDVPSINIVIDEQDSDVGIDTRLESFIDILNMKKDNIDFKISG